LCQPVSATYWGHTGLCHFLGFVRHRLSACFCKRFYFLYRLMRLGKQENRFDRIGERIKAMLIEIVPQWCTLKNVNSKRTGPDSTRPVFSGASACFFLSLHHLLSAWPEALGSPLD